ncbi:hypothetical protein LCGC14_1974470, partial [marine sediment metagenome]
DATIADCVVDVVVTTPGSGTTAAGLVFRGSDYTGASEDYWYAKITPGTVGSDFELIEYAAGAATQRAAADLDFAASTAFDIRTILDGQTISCFVDNISRISYASASVNETETQFGLRDEGDANVSFDNFAIYPRTSSVYDAQLDGV